ncbi:hypothetical protein C8R46DRAFT_1092866 [Mycena filopes]|nr:hypothetical protein C8R46DRAFT_1092866 [Mycena filopes]
MALDPRQAIDSLLAAFNVSRETTKRLEDTLALERRVADEAITEANANTVALSLTLGADIAKLQQEIVDLKDAAAQRERDVIDASNDWRKKLSGALEGFNNSATLRARCTELDETVDTLKQENKDLKRRLAEAAEAQAEDDDAEESAQEKRYDALQAKYNELKRAYSEIHAVQEERMSIAEEHERLALEAAQQQADAEGALERLQAQYDDLKNKKPARRKNNEVVDDLHKQVEQLTAELAKASKITEGAVKKLGKCTTANVELTRKYKAVQKERDQLDAANAALAKQSKGALKTTEATSEKYDELKAIAISLEADNEKLQLVCWPI